MAELSPDPLPKESDTLADLLAVSSVWASRIAYSVILAGVALGAALMASPGLSSQKICT